MEGSPGPETAADVSKKVSFRFCRECSNLLYPLEDPGSHKLMFACRSCQYSEDAAATCIYRNSLKEEVAETAGNIQDVAQDPTVGSASALFTTSNNLHDSFESLDSAYDSSFNTEDDLLGEAASSMCTLCGQEITCPFCGGPSDGGIMLEADDPSPTDPQQEADRVEQERRERALSGAATGTR